MRPKTINKALLLQEGVWEIELSWTAVIVYIIIYLLAIRKELLYLKLIYITNKL